MSDDQSQHIDQGVAALCAETQDRQSEILNTLDRVLVLSQFPSRSILDDLLKVWDGAK